MSKEMIISVNGREKKIAILTNGEVSEFYIERGDEENSGVVGNIYKGRVMRVLPGMQSAFVDIGLERDAFLYVSDFFDEEEEIERIVMEKSKKSSSDEAEKEATDHVQKQRLKREKQMEEAQDIAEPLAEAIKEDSDDEEDSKDDKRKSSRRGRNQTSKKQEESEEQKEKKSDEKDEQKSDDKLQRGRRGGRGRKTDDPDSERDSGKEKDSNRQNKSSNRRSNKKDEEKESTDNKFNMPEPVFDFEDSDFERIVDEDADTGDLFKDAYMQEAIVDKVRAIEFDMETTGPAEVGSFMDSVTSDSGGFERIADEDDEDEQTEEKPKSKRSTRSRRSNKKTEIKADDTDSDISDEKEMKTPAKSKTTRRKSTANSKTSADKEETENEDTESNNKTPAKKTPPKKKTTSRRKAKKATNKAASVEEKDSTAEMAVRRGGRGRRSGTNSRDSSNKKDEDSNGGGNRSGGKYRGSQPTITELLNEGQEIIVQIAKEPIAKKGARITSHIALPGRFIVYMPTIEHLGVSRRIESANERNRLRKVIQQIRDDEDIPSGGFIVRTAGIGAEDEDLRDDARYLVRTWLDIKRDAEKVKSPAVVHQDLDLIQRLLRDQLSNEFSAIRVDSEDEYMRIVEFINRIQPKLVKRVKLHTKDEPILETYNVQDEVEKALKPRVWLKSGGYLVINQTEALVAIDVNTGKFVGKGNARLEETITKTNMEAVVEIARQIRLRDLGGIIVLDLIDMDDRRNRMKVQNALQEALLSDKSPNKVLSFNDFGLIIMTRKRVKQSLERTLCTVCDYCEGAGWVKSPQSICYEILDEARRLSKVSKDMRRTTIRVHPDVLTALRGDERPVLDEIEDYLGDVDLRGDSTVHQTQFDFAFV